MPSRRVSAVTVVLALASALPLSAQPLPLTMSKSFSPSNVAIGGTKTTTMTVTITNPNSFTVTGISFSDTYPAGLVPDVIGSYTCGPGSALFNGSGWAFGGATLGPGASCDVPIQMHATTAGAIVNTTSSVTGTGVPTGSPASATLNVVGYSTVQPCRIVDTRAGDAPALLAASERSFAIVGVCGIPSTATSVQLNVTAVSPSAAGEIRLFSSDLPSGTPVPTVVAFSAGQTRAGNAVVTVGADGKIVAASTANGTVELVLDVCGYFD